MTAARADLLHLVEVRDALGLQVVVGVEVDHDRPLLGHRLGLAVSGNRPPYQYAESDQRDESRAQPAPGCS